LCTGRFERRDLRDKRYAGQETDDSHETDHYV
jgi:hypothetical protein